VRTVVGPGSPVQTQTPMLYLDVELAPGSSHTTRIPANQSGLVYVVDGEVQAGGASASEGQALAVVPGGGEIATGPGGRYLLVAGRPHGEPVQLRGPYVD
jgi:redox-sensitive bicupin YhaK (pirin superfamily)